MRKNYEEDHDFEKFVKEAVALSSLPVTDLEAGLKHLEENHVFEDQTAKDFKDYFIKYICQYWVEGCYPPIIWSTFY